MPQSIPPGLAVTVPEPYPDVETDSVGVGARNVAVTSVLALTTRVHGFQPEHPPPLQFEKYEPVSDFVVSVTELPAVKFLTQSVPGAAVLQLIPPMELITSPLPPPARCIVMVNEPACAAALVGCSKPFSTINTKRTVMKIKAAE